MALCAGVVEAWLLKALWTGVVKVAAPLGTSTIAPHLVSRSNPIMGTLSMGTPSMGTLSSHCGDAKFWCHPAWGSWVFGARKRPVACRVG